MLIGVTAPNIGGLATSGAAAEIVEHAERLGFASVWTVDHVVLPHISSESYPYTGLPGVSLPPTWPIQGTRASPARRCADLRSCGSYVARWATK